MKKCFRYTFFSFLAAIILFSNSLYGTQEAKSNYVIHNAWSPAASMVAPSRAGYFTLSNTSSETIVIVGASSYLFGSVSIHESKMVDGYASMSPVSQLVLEPKDKIEFESKGMHLMLMQPSATFNEMSKIIRVDLLLDDGGTIELALTIKDMMVSKSMDHKGQGPHAHH